MVAEWYDVLATALGVGKPVLWAGAVYGGFAWLDRKVRKERRDEVAAFLQGGGYRGQPVDAAAVVLSLFEAVFGTRHWSLKCFVRSVLLTLVIVGTLILFFLKDYDTAFPPLPFKIDEARRTFSIVLFYFVASIMPDYLSLWKGRVLLSLMRQMSLACLVMILTADFLLSASIPWLLVSGLNYMMVFVVGIDLPSEHDLLGYFIFILESPLDLVGAMTSRSDPYLNPLAEVFFTSTLSTSVWTVVVGISATLLRLLVSLNFLAKITNYLFDVTEKPIESLGIVAAALTFLVSVVVSVL